MDPFLFLYIIIIFIFILLIFIFICLCKYVLSFINVIIVSQWWFLWQKSKWNEEKKENIEKKPTNTLQKGKNLLWMLMPWHWLTAIRKKDEIWTTWTKINGQIFKLKKYYSFNFACFTHSSFSSKLCIKGSVQPLKLHLKCQRLVVS